MATSLNIMIIGAHPDDCEIRAGGFAALCSHHGHHVRMVSMTNGCTGHYEMGGGALVRRRWAEMQASAAVIGAESLMLDVPNNGLEPNLHLRYRLIEVIREFEADIVISHRTCDYHPDHRYTATLVMDTSTAVTNPNVCPLTPALKTTPTYLNMADHFKSPAPFTPDFVISIDSVIDRKMDMLHAHSSQMYEWLPWELGILEDVPTSEEDRKVWLKEWRAQKDSDIAQRFGDELRKRYGDSRAADVTYAEAFAFSEYGGTQCWESLQDPEHASARFPF